MKYEDIVKHVIGTSVLLKTTQLVKELHSASVNPLSINSYNTTPCNIPEGADLKKYLKHFLPANSEDRFSRA
jgi:hypothetical protein